MTNETTGPIPTTAGLPRSIPTILLAVGIAAGAVLGAMILSGCDDQAEADPYTPPPSGGPRGTGGSGTRAGVAPDLDDDEYEDLGPDGFTAEPDTQAADFWPSGRYRVFVRASLTGQPTGGVGHITLDTWPIGSLTAVTTSATISGNGNGTQTLACGRSGPSYTVGTVGATVFTSGTALIAWPGILQAQPTASNPVWVCQAATPIAESTANFRKQQMQSLQQQ